MTIERNIDNTDNEATVRMPSLPSDITVDEELEDSELEDSDLEETLVRDNWETETMCRVAPRLAALQSAIEADSSDESRFGWEGAALRRLQDEVQRTVR